MSKKKENNFLKQIKKVFEEGKNRKHLNACLFTLLTPACLAFTPPFLWHQRCANEQEIGASSNRTHVLNNSCLTLFMFTFNYHSVDRGGLEGMMGFTPIFYRSQLSIFIIIWMTIESLLKLINRFLIFNNVQRFLNFKVSINLY